MKEAIRKRWKIGKKDNALLFFSQLIEELVFHYTIDSFKLPAHNVTTLLMEAKKTIEHIQTTILKEGSFEPVRQELVDTIAKDKIVRSILGYDTDMICKALGSSSLQEVEKFVGYLIAQLKTSYFDQLKHQIKAQVAANDFDDLIRLSKSFSIEVLERGFSAEYVNLANYDCFVKTQVSSIDSLDEFFARFDQAEKSFEVYFGVGSEYGKHKKIISAGALQIIEGECFGASVEQDILDFSHRNPVKAKITVSAKDGFKAFSKARFFVQSVASYFSLLRHQGDFAISPDGVIQDAGAPTFYSGSNNPIFRRPDILGDSKLLTKLVQLLTNAGSKKVDRPTQQRISLSVFRHRTSLQSISYENQLVDLWSGIEILVPVYTKGSQDKIVQIMDAVVPIATLQYFHKILWYMFRSVLNSRGEKHARLLLKSVDSDEYNAFRALMILPSQQLNFTKLQTIVEDFPLLSKRLSYYRDKLANPKEVLRIFKNHQQRVRWQIQRIYRGRNLIVHAGKTPYKLEVLIENLHFYFDTILDCVNLEIKNSFIEITIEHVYLKYKFQNDAYIRNLEEYQKSGQIDEKYIKTLVVNDEF